MTAPGVGGRDGVGDLGIVWKRFKEPLAEDVENIVAVENNGSELHGPAMGLVLEVAEGAVDRFPTALIGGLEVGDDNTDVGKFRLVEGDK